MGTVNNLLKADMVNLTMYQLPNMAQMTTDERVLIRDVAMVTDSGCLLPTDAEFCHSSECRCRAVKVTVLLLLTVHSDVLSSAIRSVEHMSRKSCSQAALDSSLNIPQRHLPDNWLPQRMCTAYIG